MKKRIEKLAKEMPGEFIWVEGTIDEAGILIEEAVEFGLKVANEALELAAAMQEQRSTERHGYDKYQDATAIRKLKVTT